MALLVPDAGGLQRLPAGGADPGDRLWSLARESQAGRFGTFILFFVLALGIFGFVIKEVLTWILEQ
ncbi:MAG: DUF2788 domain-containing protein [Pseudomonadota bacterium]